jgi:hypothetical protein
MRTDGCDEINSCFSQFCERAYKSTPCSQSAFMRCVCVTGKSAPVFLHNVDLLDFRTQTACVYSAVRAECLKIMDVSLSL